MEENIVEIKDLDLSIGNFNLLINKLFLKKGNTLCLMGPNGSGKTTLLKSICGLYKTNGQIRIFGKSNKEIKNRRKIAYLSQEPNLFRGSVFNNIAYPLRIRGLNKKEIINRVRTEAEKFNIGNLLDKNVLVLSGGEARKTSIARALIYKPKLVLLDEPLNNLDFESERVLYDDLSRVFKENTSIYASHKNNEVLSLGGSIAFMDKGSIVQSGSADDVIGYPNNKKIARFLGVENIFNGKVIEWEKGLAKIIIGKNILFASSSIKSGKIIFCLRPEDVFISKGKKENVSSRNKLKGRVEEINDMKNYVNLNINCGIKINASVANQTIKEMNIKKKDEIFIYIKATAIHLIRDKDD